MRIASRLLFEGFQEILSWRIRIVISHRINEVKTRNLRYLQFGVIPSYANSRQKYSYFSFNRLNRLVLEYSTAGIYAQSYRKAGNFHPVELFEFLHYNFHFETSISEVWYAPALSSWVTVDAGRSFPVEIFLRNRFEIFGSSRIL